MKSHKNGFFLLQSLFFLLFFSFVSISLIESNKKNIESSKKKSIDSKILSISMGMEEIFSAKFKENGFNRYYFKGKILRTPITLLLDGYYIHSSISDLNQKLNINNLILRKDILDDELAIIDNYAITNEEYEKLKEKIYFLRYENEGSGDKKLLNLPFEEVSYLPKISKININTTSKSIFKNIMFFNTTKNMNILDEIYGTNKTIRFQNIEEFLNKFLLSIEEKEKLSRMFGTNSDFFVLKTSVMDKEFNVLRTVRSFFYANSNNEIILYKRLYL